MNLQHAVTGRNQMLFTQKQQQMKCTIDFNRTFALLLYKFETFLYKLELIH